MAICVMNQGFIGKKFKISPESKNNDGLFEICFIEKKRGFLANLKVIHKISKGNYFSAGFGKTKTSQKERMTFRQDYQFMGDGEILEKNKIFNLTILPKELSFFY